MRTVRECGNVGGGVGVGVGGKDVATAAAAAASNRAIYTVLVSSVRVRMRLTIYGTVQFKEV